MAQRLIMHWYTHQDVYKSSLRSFRRAKSAELSIEFIQSPSPPVRSCHRKLLLLFSQKTAARTMPSIHRHLIYSTNLCVLTLPCYLGDLILWASSLSGGSKLNIRIVIKQCVNWAASRHATATATEL